MTVWIPSPHFFKTKEIPLRDILLSFAKNEAYLLSSILATGASNSIQKIQ